MARKRVQIDCIVCGQPDMRGHRAKYCRGCAKTRMPSVRATNCKYCDADIRDRDVRATTCFNCSERNRRSYKAKNQNEVARRITRYAVKQGFLLAPSCYICIDCKARQANSYDHRDYTKPLEVDAVCMPCNSKRGKGIPLWLPAVSEAA